MFTVGKDRYWDMHLLPYDLLASQAHAKMLGEVGLLSAEESKALVKELKTMTEEFEAGAFFIEEEYEDMHSKIEAELTMRLGDTGKKIHTARSRNDQVLVAFSALPKTGNVKHQNQNGSTFLMF